MFLNQCSAISQDPSKQLPSSPASAAKLDTQSVAIREQLARVQASFDQSNAPKWSRIAFVGHPQGVIEAAMAAARSAYNLIDMTRHSGEHPRIGAMVGY